MVVTTAALVWIGGRKTVGSKKVYPLAETIGAVVAALGWGLAMPGSPLIAELTGKQKVAAPIVIAFIAVAITAIIARHLKSQRS